MLQPAHFISNFFPFQFTEDELSCTILYTADNQLITIKKKPYYLKISHLR